MNRHRLSVPFPALIGTLLPLLVSGPATAQGSDPAPLDWLTGCWESRSADRVIHEQWMKPLGGLMLGINRTVIRDTARSHEYLRIESRDAGPVYIAKPYGQRETTFRSVEISGSLAVFENPEHDFPQRISYRRIAADSLLARAQGTRDGRSRSLEFLMARVPCEP